MFLFQWIDNQTIPLSIQINVLITLVHYSPSTQQNATTQAAFRTPLCRYQQGLLPKVGLLKTYFSKGPIASLPPV